MASWRDLAAAVSWNVRPFIGGRYRASRSNECFENIDPATEKVLCEVAAGSGEDVDAAVKVARQRFEDGSWSELPPARRAEALLRLADLIVERRNGFALLDSLEMGKPIQAAVHDAEHFAPYFLRSAASFADKLFGATAPLNRHTIEFNSYEPRGVVGLITPWNFPLANVAIKLGPALAAGNTVVLKPSELAASSALKLAELALEAGIPEGVINVVPGLGNTVGAALASHWDVDLVSFTGSTSTGRRVMESAARSNGKPVLLECGGKCPQVVFDDVDDIDHVAEATTQGFLWNQGQVCSARTRLIAHSSVKDELVKKIVARAAERHPEHPLEESTTFGPLASPAQRDRVRAYVDRGISAGAKPVLLGKIRNAGGCYVSPTVFDDVQPEMTIARDEIFGPVLCVHTFQSEEEAITLANATEYGLAATVWTREVGRSKRLARAIKAGAVSLRTGRREGPSTGCELSHEPRKASGYGAETGLAGLQSYAALKAISFAGA